MFIDPERGDRIYLSVESGQILMSDGGNDVWFTADQADELADALRSLITDVRNQERS